MSPATSNRFATQAGIAIAPILFVVTLLGILAAAIAAGSGAFTSGTARETASTKASALIQIGNQLRFAADRLVSNDYDADSIITDATNTTSAASLFSPTGGGISAPSVTMAATPASDTWLYTKLPVTNFGTSATELVAFLRVSKEVCEQAIVKATALTNDANDLWADVGDLTNDPSGATGWPGLLEGKGGTGCLHATGTTTGYYFFQVLVTR